MITKCEDCNVEIDTKTNRAKSSDGYWLYMCKECYQKFLNCIRDYNKKKKEKETGCPF